METLEQYKKIKEENEKEKLRHEEKLYKQRMDDIEAMRVYT